MPPTKKAAVEASQPAATAAKASSFPSKISKNCTLIQLREEATFRGLDLGTVPLSKATLLEILGDGSTSSKAAAEKLSKSKKTTAAAATEKKKSNTANTKGKTKATSAAAKKSAASPSAAAKNTKTAPAAPTTTSSANKAATKKGTSATTKSDASGKKQKEEKNVEKASAVAKKPSDSVTSPKKKNKNSSNKPLSSPSKQTTLKFAVASAAGVVVVAPSESANDNNAAKKRKKLPTEPTFFARKHSKTNTGPSRKTAIVSAAPTTVSSAPVVSAVAAKPASTASEQQLPRISKKLTLAQLKEEAAARQLYDAKSLPKTKADLLHHLVDASIHVAETPQYKAYQALLRRVQNEKSALYAQSLANRQAEERKKEERAQKKYEKERAEAAQERADEKARQACLHQHSFPRVHPHPLARSKDLTIEGIPRRKRCDVCHSNFSKWNGFHPTLYSCEPCDWDICGDCFSLENMNPEERRRHEEKQRIEREKQRREEEKREREREKQRRKEEEEEERRWNAQKEFKAATIKPTQQNKDLDAKAHKFVVWCSDGYGNDGWHSYNGPPTQHFDTSWKTAKEANDRARYLFFWKNPWGLSPQDVDDDNGVPKAEMREGLATYTVEPADSSCWTVGVVPSVAFRHLPESSTYRHNLDDDDDDFHHHHAIRIGGISY